MNKEDRIRRAYEAIAHVATHYQAIDPDSDDADDLVETLVLTNSLLECGGVNHRHLVASFRTGLKIEINGHKIENSGNRDNTTQMGKLRASRDLFYLASDGDTNGAAMHIMPIALFYTDLDEMIYAANFVARITHASEASRMAAVVLALAYRLHLLSGPFDDRMLRVLIRAAAKKLQMERVGHHIELAIERFFDNSLKSVSANVGFSHAAISSPISAILVQDNVVKDFLTKPPTRPRTIPDGDLFDYDVSESEYIQSPRAKFGGTDADTFYSMLISLRALSQHSPLPESFPHKVFYRFDNIAERLAARWP